MLRGIYALIQGLADPRVGLNILRQLVFNEQGVVVDIPDSNVEFTFPGFIFAVINWILFGPLLYLVAAPLYFVYAIYSFIVDVNAAIEYAVVQTFYFVKNASHIFFLTGFALQAIRVFLRAGGVPPEALSIRYLEELLNIFFSLCTVFVGAPRRVRQPPGKDNPIWLIAALITIIFIANDVKDWSPAWITAVAHFVVFVGFAGTTRQRVMHPGLVQHGRRDVYQTQALLLASLLGLSLAITETGNWPHFWRWAVVIGSAVALMIMLDANSTANAHTLYVIDPDDERLQPPTGLTREFLSLFGSIAVSILATMYIGDWQWHYKWILIIFLSFSSFLFRDVFRIMFGDIRYPIVQLSEGANRPPEPPREVQRYREDPDLDRPEVFIDRFGRPLDVMDEERLPERLANIGPFPTRDEYFMLHWYRHRLRGRLRRMGLLLKQQVYVAERVFAMISREDITRSSYQEDLLERYINRAIQYESENNPDYF